MLAVWWMRPAACWEAPRGISVGAKAPPTTQGSSTLLSEWLTFSSTSTKWRLLRATASNRNMRWNLLQQTATSTANALTGSQQKATTCCSRLCSVTCKKWSTSRVYVIKCPVSIIVGQLFQTAVISQAFHLCVHCAITETVVSMCMSVAENFICFRMWVII